MGRQLTVSGLYNSYKDYKNEFFPRILENETVTDEDKSNSALTEKKCQAKIQHIESTCMMVYE